MTASIFKESVAQTVFTATFVGSSNRFDAVVTSASEGRCQVKNEEIRIAPTQDLHDGDSVLILVRPEMMAMHDSQDAILHNQQETFNMINGTIQLCTFLGPLTRFIVQTQDGATLTADIPSQQASDFYVAQNVVLSFLPKACQALPLTSAKPEEGRINV